MNTKRLAAAIRQNASDLRDLREASTLLRVLAHVVDGMPLAKAFGSPESLRFAGGLGVPHPDWPGDRRRPRAAQQRRQRHRRRRMHPLSQPVKEPHHEAK